MDNSRRSFLKMVSAFGGMACLSIGSLGLAVKEAKAYAGTLKMEGAKEVVTICPFCSVCCSVIAYVRDDMLLNTEGDPDFPVNEGALCAKGAALFNMYSNDHRLLKPLYRAPYSTTWEEKDWDWTLQNIARRIKDTRDKDFMEKNADGKTVNRWETFCHFGTSHASNEECAVMHQALRGLGVVHMDHQARV